MQTPEGSNNIEGGETNQMSPEQLASLKFDVIFDEINNNTPISYVDEIGKKISLITASSTVDGNYTSKVMSIKKNGKITYRLMFQNGTYELSYGKNLEETINNLTPDELLSKIMPFERRLNERKMLQQQQRQEVLRKADEYAYQQDQQDADRLLQENGFA